MYDINHELEDNFNEKLEKMNSWAKLVALIPQERQLAAITPALKEHVPAKERYIMEQAAKASSELYEALQAYNPDGLMSPVRA